MERQSKAGSGVTLKSLPQLGLHSGPAPLIRQLTAVYHRKTGDLGVFQRTINNLGDRVADPGSSQLRLKIQISLDGLQTLPFFPIFPQNN